MGWLRSGVRCPVDAEAKQWLEMRMNWLLSRFGAQRLREVEVILPRPQFFPDPYNATPDDVRLLLDRVCVYMGVHPAEITLTFFEHRHPRSEGAGEHEPASAHAAGEATHMVAIDVAQVDDPLALVASMAHEVATAILASKRLLTPAGDANDFEPLTSLLTVFLGMGVITSGAVIRERYWQSGHFSGWTMGRHGHLTMPMYGYALALFALGRGELRPEWAAELRLDVRTAFKEALRYVQETGDTTFRAEPTPGRP